MELGAMEEVTTDGCMAADMAVAEEVEVETAAARHGGWAGRFNEFRRGKRVETSGIREQSGEAAAQVESQDEGSFQRYGKVFPGLKTPFDLPIECFPIYEKMLDEDPGKVDQVNIMIRGAVAESTATGYSGVVNRFHGFCAEEGYTFPNFTKEAVLQFMQRCLAAKAGLAYFGKLLPSLQLLETVVDAEQTALTPAVRAAASAIKRELAKDRGIVKKAIGYDFRVIEDLIKKEVGPHVRTPEAIDAFAFRALVRASVIYFTFCRFDDFKRLRDTDVQDKGTHIEIVFERSKNDQFGDNSVSVIPARPSCAGCPVALLRLYFKRFGLKFGGGGKLLNFRIRRVAGKMVAMPFHGLSASNATKWTRKLLEKHGYEARGFTEKSMKVQGVTELLDTGEALENVMVFGRWKSQTTPLHYRNLSVKFKLAVASNIPM